jgi:hypothetical protein
VCQEKNDDTNKQDSDHRESKAFEDEPFHNLDECS